jgi:histidinol-phosphate aminotransferase
MMDLRHTFSRRGFVGGVATALGYMGLKPARVWAQNLDGMQQVVTAQQAMANYDRMVKLGNNENPWGPSPKMLETMNGVWKYANRYGYPDGGITKIIADSHGVKEDNVLLGAGSGEILRVVGLTYLDPDKKVVGAEVSYETVYNHASGLRAEAFKIPLLADYRQDIPATIKATNRNYREVGFVYLCNPNNPTGRTVSAAEIKDLLDNIPQDMPVLIDEAYHHFVEDPAYATSLPYVLEGRQVIIARTFSKIYGMAGLRLGYAVATKEIIDRMRPYTTGSINALAKWGAAVALQDPNEEIRVRTATNATRKKTVERIHAMGFETIPSETNFFMVHLKKPVQPVIQAFREKGIIVGRPFPPLVEHLRVSVGTDAEMDKFVTAFREILPSAVTSAAAG